MPPCHFVNVEERAHELAQRCTELVRIGNDFPTVWSTLLRRHALVDDVPQAKIEGGRALLEMRLVTGEMLVFDGDAKKFSVS